MSSKEVKEFVLVPKDKWEIINSHKRASETRMIKSTQKSSKCETAKVMKKDTTKSTQQQQQEAETMIPGFVTEYKVHVHYSVSIFIN